MSEYIYATNGEPMMDKNGIISIPRVQVVRCRNCKYLATDEFSDYCTLFDFEDVKSMGDKFCAWGEGKQSC